MKKLNFYKKLLLFSILLLTAFPPNTHASSFWDFVHRIAGDDIEVKIKIYSHSSGGEVRNSLLEINSNMYGFKSPPAGGLNLFFETSYFEKVAKLTWTRHVVAWAATWTEDICENVWDPDAGPLVWDPFLQKDVPAGAWVWQCRQVIKTCDIAAEGDYRIYRIVNGQSTQIANIVNGEDYKWAFDFVKNNKTVSFYDSLHDVPSGATIAYNLYADVVKYTLDCPTPFTNQNITHSFDSDGDGWADFVEPGPIMAPLMIPIISILM